MVFIASLGNRVINIFSMIVGTMCLVSTIFTKMKLVLTLLSTRDRGNCLQVCYTCKYNLPSHVNIRGWIFPHIFTYVQKLYGRSLTTSVKRHVCSIIAFPITVTNLIYMNYDAKQHELGV